MKKLRGITLINVILIGVLCIVDLILGIIFKFDSRFFISSSLFLSGFGIVNLIFILIKEIYSLQYSASRFDFLAHVCHVVLGVLGYYAIRYINQYDQYAYIYWISFVLGIIIPIIISYFLNKRDKKNNNKQGQGPKFMVNRK